MLAGIWQTLRYVTAQKTQREVHPPDTYINPVEKGMYYLQSRYYDPGLKRFINADNPTLISYLTQASTLGGNLFAYCENNVVMNVDLHGTKYYSFNIKRVKLLNLQGTYVGNARCWEGIASLIVTAGLVGYIFISMGISILKISVSGEFLSMGLSSFITVPLGVIGFLIAAGGIIYAAYMVSVILTAISYTIKYSKYKLTKAWKRSQYTYVVDRA